MLTLWQLLQLLPTNRNNAKSTKTLNNELEELGVERTLRTIQRYVELLEKAFSGVVCRDGENSTDRSGIAKWYWNCEASSGLPGISLTKALSIQFIEKLLQPLLPAAMLASLQSQFRQAERTLGTHKHNTASANWPDKISYVSPVLAMISPDIKPEVLEAVQDAVLNSQQLEVIYRSVHDQTATYKILHPLGLVQRGLITYLIATTFSYPDFRAYALHRISHARSNQLPVVHPNPISLKDYTESGAMQFGSTASITLQAWTSKELADYLQETKLSLTQKLARQQDGFLLTAEVQNSWQLRWWLLSQGKEIEVLEPEWLRQEIITSLQQTAANYVKTSHHDFPVSGNTPIKFWKIAPGKDARYWEQCYTQGYIVIGWNEYNSIKHYENFDELLSKLGWNKAITCSTLWDFANTINVGDIVIANKGRNQAVGLGIITSNYRYLRENSSGPSRPEGMNNLRSVKWLTNQPVALSGWSFDTPTVCNLGIELGEKILIGDENEFLAALLSQWGFTTDLLLKETGIAIADYERNE